MLTKTDIQNLPSGLLIPHYLMSSYCYYQLNQSPMTDGAFDYLCVRLAGEYDSLEHQHKHLVEPESLDAGTCMLGMKEYPAIVANGAERYLAACSDRSILGMIAAPERKPASTTRRVVRRASPKKEEPQTKRVVRRRAQVSDTSSARPRIVRRSRG